MKAVILAGGRGSRLNEETDVRPKPMVPIGGRPILWHIMKMYSHFGIDDFVICLGYKGHVIKEYFANFRLYNSDVTIDLRDSSVRMHDGEPEPWTVTLVDTGDATETGGRLRRVRDHLDGETFCMAYGDGVGDVQLAEVLDLHRERGRRATLTAVRPPGRFGVVETTGDAVTTFQEKPLGDGGWVNGGFFVLEPTVLDLIDGDATVWEKGPLARLTADDELTAYHHRGFWHPMDTMRDKTELDRLWNSGDAPWRVWR